MISIFIIFLYILFIFFISSLHLRGQSGSISVYIRLSSSFVQRVSLAVSGLTEIILESALSHHDESHFRQQIYVSLDLLF